MQSASSSFQNEIQPSLECPVCTTPYNRHQHAPLILLCGHTLCKSCVNRLFHPSKNIVCPLDRKVDNRKFAHIPQSLLVIEMIDTITRMKDQIDFLKLTPEEKRTRKAERLQAAAADCTEFIQQLNTQIEEAKEKASTTIAKIRETFSRLSGLLEGRKQVLEEETTRLHSEQTERYKSLMESFETQCASQGEAECQSATPTQEVPVLEFKYTYVKNDKAVSEALRELGKVDMLVNKVPYECEHFVNITYWMLPPCCGRHYCCNKCHDKKETHSWLYADKMVCMFCSREQPYRKLPNSCEYCSEEHKGVISKT